MIPRFFDIHSHLNFPQYDSDREGVIERLKENGVWTVTIGTDIETSQSVVELANKHEGLFATVGVHPEGWLDSWNDGALENLLQNKKVVGIGECGLDYADRDPAPGDRKIGQKELFIKQIELAIKLDKPLMIHCRDAYEDTYDILSSYSRKYGEKLRGDMHFFAGDVKTAKKFLGINFYLSFTGVITFASEYSEVVDFVPMDRIMAETDAPFVAPAAYRGKRNEPLYVAEVVKRIAEIKNEDLETVRKATVNNSMAFFGLNQK